MRPAPPDSSAPAANAPPRNAALIAVVGAPGSGQAQLVAALRAALSDPGMTVSDDNGLILAPQGPISLCLLMRSATPGDRVEAQLRLALLQHGQNFSVLSGPAETRLGAALAAWQAHLRERSAGERPPSRWRHACGRCGDGDCERHLFDQLPRPR